MSEQPFVLDECQSIWCPYQKHAHDLQAALTAAEQERDTLKAEIARIASEMDAWEASGPETFAAMQRWVKRLAALSASTKEEP